MAEQTRDDLLAQEYQLIQKLYEDSGARALTVKAWSVTFSAAGLGLAYTSRTPVILLFAGLGALVFWAVEALLKIHQKSHLPRIALLEGFFRNEEKDVAPFQTNQAWRDAFHARGRVWRGVKIASYPHVMLPHIIVVAAAAALYCNWPLGN